MEPKKKSKIILIIIMVLMILILVTGIGYTYYATDVFKSDKDLFFKYLVGIADEKNGFIEDDLKQFLEKRQNTAYQNNGTITVKVDGYEDETINENVNRMNFTFDGQIDPTGNKVLQNMSLNYSEDVNFPVTYKKIEDTMGMQTKYIGSKYVVTKQEENLLEDQNVNLEKWNQLIQKKPFTKEEAESIKQTYFNVIKETLPKESFSKIEEKDRIGYQLTLKPEELKNIIVKCLEVLKNDQVTLDKINQYLESINSSSKITAITIDNQIKQLNNEDTSNEKEEIQVIVYQEKGKTTALTIKINELEFKLEKQQMENDLQYKIEAQINSEQMKGKISFLAKFTGLLAKQKVEENYQLAIEAEDLKYQYNLDNAVEFIDGVEIEEFNNNNSLFLDELEEEEKNEFLNAVMERITAVNKSHMEELGLAEDENPLAYIIPQFGNYLTIENIDEEEVNTFNQKFENYESTNLQGVTVKGLLSTIQLHNESQEDEDRKIKEIHFDGEEYETTEQNIVFLKSSVETEESYRVEFERNENTGMIYRAVINKK